MGLDVSAYKNIRFVGHTDGLEEMPNEDNLVPIYATTDSFRERIAPFPVPGEGIDWYEYSDHFTIAAGSYSGYNRWRAWLSQTMIRCTPEEVWHNKNAMQNEPFFELVCFSDCEGIIGTNAARELARDFAMYDDVAKKNGDEWEYYKYTEWRKVFEMAAENGLVEFR